MQSIFSNSPILKNRNLAYRIIIPFFSVISSIFILAPVIVYLYKQSYPLTEMPENNWYYIFRGLFGLSLIFCSIVFAVYKNVAVTAIPAVFGICAALFPLCYRIDKYKQYKALIEMSSMTADYLPYIVVIGIYALFIILCFVYILYALCLYRINILVLIFSALSITGTIFLTIDRTKSLEFRIFSLFDILCFTYAALTSLIPFILIFATTRRNKQSETVTDSARKRYQPRRMK